MTRLTLLLLATAIAAALLARRSKHSLVASTRFAEPYDEAGLFV